MQKLCDGSHTWTDKTASKASQNSAKKMIKTVATRSGKDSYWERYPPSTATTLPVM
jgi:hypothetical protein